LDLLVVRAAERVEALDFDFDLDLVMGSSEVMRRHPPHHLSPAQAKPPAGQDPEARIRHFKSPQQRSDQTRKPVKSEQDSCSFLSNHGLCRWSLLGQLDGDWQREDWRSRSELPPQADH